MSGKFALVAQLDRALPSDGKGCEFDSRRVHQVFHPKHQTQKIRWHLAILFFVVLVTGFGCHMTDFLDGPNPVCVASSTLRPSQV